MPEQGYTVSPVITSDEVDGHQIVDFSVQTNRHGNNTSTQDFLVDQQHDLVGNTWADVEEPDQGSQLAPDYEFRSALHEVYPLYDQALAWAGNGGLSPEEIEQFDAVVTGDDVSAMYPAIEGLISRFQETGKARAPRQQQAPVPQERAREYEPQPQVEPDQFDYHFGSMFDGADVDLAEDYEVQAREQQAEGDHIGAFMSAGLAAYHDGECTGREVIQALMNQFGQEAALQFFNQILE